MPARAWFPTLIYHEALQQAGLEKFNAALADECRNLRDYDAAGRRWSAKNYPGGYTSYGSMNELHRFSTTFEILKKQIDLEVKKAARHLELDLRNMLLVSECVARAALERSESRGGHTREDHPTMDRKWRNINLLCRLIDPTGGLAATDPVQGQIALSRDTTEPIRADLLALFDKEELVKYLAEEELYE